MPNYHLCFTSHKEVLFRDEEDMNHGFNSLCSSLYKTDSACYAYVLQNPGAAAYAPTRMYTPGMYRPGGVSGEGHLARRAGITAIGSRNSQKNRMFV